jgi:hypothetical protein
MFPSSTQVTYSPPKPLQTQSAGSSGHRDGPGWSTPRRYTGSPIRDQRILDSICKYYCLFLFGIVLPWSILQISCILSIDYYYLSSLINHNNGINIPICVHHISMGGGAVAYNYFLRTAYVITSNNSVLYRALWQLCLFLQYFKTTGFVIYSTLRQLHLLFIPKNCVLLQLPNNCVCYSLLVAKSVVSFPWCLLAACLYKTTNKYFWLFPFCVVRYLFLVFPKAQVLSN